MSFAEKLPSLLNAAQLAAVTHPGGPLLVVAGAGTGKTRVITCRVAWLIERGVPAWRIMAVTFTNKAAREMQQRIWQETGNREVWVSTFHSMAARLLRIEARRLGYTSEFSIYDENDSLSLVKRIMKATGDAGGGFGPAQVRARISRAKNDLLSPGDTPARDAFSRLARQVYKEYQAALANENAMDFDDLLLNLLRLLEEFPEVREKYARRFLHLLVDEFQDTNLPQYLIAKHLAGVHRNITVTGDPDQSIYSWRGARLGNILGFHKDFPGCRVIRLEENYRSPAHVIAAADALIKHNDKRLERSLFATKPSGRQVELVCFEDDVEEAAGVVERIAGIAKRQKRSYSDFAVLMRTNAQSALFEEECLKNGIAYVVFGGTAFFQRREVKDVVAYLRLVVNPRDDSAFTRAIMAPPRGIGTKTLERLSERAAGRGSGMLEAADTAFASSLHGRAGSGLAEFIGVFKRLMALPFRPAAGLVQAVLKESGYLAWLEKHGEDERIENVAELVNVARRFDADNPDGNLRDFLETVALLTDQDRARPEDTKGRVLLMTLHSAKGLEFPVVFVVGLVEGKLPHARAIAEDATNALEEERRLCYVGMTRATERLYLTCYAGYTGGLVAGGPSRFIDELPAEHLHATGMTTASWDKPPTDWAQAAAEKPVRVYEAGEARGLRRGDRVRHQIFGVGRVVEVKGSRVTVNFVRFGRKRLALRFAGLERLG